MCKNVLADQIDSDCKKIHKKQNKKEKKKILKKEIEGLLIYIGVSYPFTCQIK